MTVPTCAGGALMAGESDEQSWKLLAEQYREVAQSLPDGPRRDELLRKIRQLETAAHISSPVNSLGFLSSDKSSEKPSK